MERNWVSCGQMYYDHNATSPIPPNVRAAVEHAMAATWANPSSPHRPGQTAASAVQQARATIARCMGTEPGSVTFTSGATEANAWVLAGSTLPVIASATEHPSVLAWAEELIPVHPNGTIDLEWLEKRLRDQPALVSVMAANNETGVIQPTDTVYNMVKESGGRFHCDATQWVGRMESKLSADYITLSAHKFGGPRGIGALISADPPDPYLRGGAQERGRRGGTLNGPGIIGFAAAIEGLQTILPTERDRLAAFCRTRGAIEIGAEAPRLPNTLCALFEHPGDLIVAGLDLEGVYASTGSACSSGSAQESHVLTAMGLKGAPVRFSFGADTPAGPAIDALTLVLARLEDACV